MPSPSTIGCFSCERICSGSCERSCFSRKVTGGPRLQLGSVGRDDASQTPPGGQLRFRKARQGIEGKRAVDTERRHQYYLGK